MKPIVLYDMTLGDKQDLISPNTCKARISLNIKEIPYQVEWLTFFTIQTELPKILKKKKKNERPTVPVIVDPNTGAVVQDSWEIALYLDRQYPDKPSLFHGETNVGIHELFYTWSFDAIVMHFAGIVLFQTYDLMTPDEKKYFRETREKYFHCTLEQLAGDPEDAWNNIGKGLSPVKKVLEKHPYITGTKVGQSDAVLTAFLHLLRKLKGETELEKRILADAKGFSEWWKRMQRYTLEQPLALEDAQ